MCLRSPPMVPGTSRGKEGRGRYGKGPFLGGFALATARSARMAVAGSFIAAGGGAGGLGCFYVSAWAHS